MIMDLLPDSIKFNWDKGNINKSLKKHNISNEEAEEVFVNQPIVLLEDEEHSKVETRQMILGKTDKKKLLSIIFTTRNKKIRIISARKMSRKERKLYEEKTKSYSKV